MASSLGSSAKPVLKIRPSTGWAALNLQEIWQFKDLLTTLALRDVKLRYRQTALGAVWVLLQPLMAAGIFSLVFGVIANLRSDNGVPYFVFSYAGLLGWNVFSNTLTKTSACLVSNSQLISKVFFPRLILPLSTIYSTLIDFAVALCMLVVLMVVFKIVPGIGILLLPVWLLMVLLLALGMGLIASALMVRYRDVGYVLPVLTQMLLYASPIAYSVSRVPAWLRPWYFLNPLSGLLEAFRWSLLGTGNIHVGYVIYASVVSVILFVWGAFAFKKMERGFADVI